MKPVKILFGLTALALVSACGLKGDLERPEPLFQEKPEPVAVPEPVKSVEPQAFEEEVPDDELLGGPDDD